MEKELNKLKAEKAKNELAATARKMLSDENITVPDSLLAYIVGEDAEKTKTAVEDFVKLFNDAVSEEVKKRAVHLPVASPKRWISEKWQKKPG